MANKGHFVVILTIKIRYPGTVVTIDRPVISIYTVFVHVLPPPFLPNFILKYMGGRGVRRTFILLLCKNPLQ
jgi:hypothetical protein